MQCLFFAGGALTALYRIDRSRWWGGRAGLLMGGLTSWMVASVVFHVVRIASPDSVHLIAGYLMVLLGAYLLLEAFLGMPAEAVPSWAVYLGKISYGLYVFHVLFLITVQLALDQIAALSSHLLLSHVLGAAIAFLATIASAHLSYQFLEKPFLTLKERFTVVHSRPE